MCVAATHAMERNQPQKVAASASRNAACNTIICTGRKGNRGLRRLKTRLRPRPETTTQASAAKGASQRSTPATCGS